MPETETTTNGDPQRSQDLVRAAALVMLIGSLPILYFCGVNFWGTIFVSHDYAARPAQIVLFGLPTFFSLLGIVTCFGLMFLQEWARKTALFLATVPVSCCLFLFLFPVIPSDSGRGAMLVVGGGIVTFVLGCLLVFMIPISIWWSMLFTRPDIRSQFRGWQTRS